MTELPPPSTDLRWSQEARLRAIDLAVFWEGRVNRAELIRRFGISVPQATNDLRDYQARAPRNLRYDTRAKTYLAEQDFLPLFGSPSAEAWLLDGEAARGMPVGLMPRPSRQIDPWVVRRILQAKRAGMALHVLYQTMDEPEPAWRCISPKAFASDGTRWHLRAWIYDSARHQDLLFPRMLEIAEGQAAGDVPPDLHWERMVSVRLRPAERLSPGQRRVIEADYGMENGGVVLEVRLALLFLFLRRQRLDERKGDVLVELANRDEVELALKEIGGPGSTKS